MGLNLADLDKWSPDAIHSVFQAAIDRASGVRSTATSVGNVLDATPWEGEAYDAAATRRCRRRTGRLPPPSTRTATTRRTMACRPGDDVISPSGKPPFYDMNLGDNRGFDPSLGPENSRVAVVVDYENGIIVRGRTRR